MDKPISQRLFFALWPDPETARAIWEVAGQLVSKVQGRRLSPEQIHLTLAFLGSINTDKTQCMHQAAAQVFGQAFTLQLDTAGHFPKPQVVWLGTSQMPVALKTFQFNLVSQLNRKCDYTPESRPFVPHITVWRKVKRVLLPEYLSPLKWPVDRFVLARSRTIPSGAEYSIVESWPLSASNERQDQS